MGEGVVERSLVAPKGARQCRPKGRKLKSEKKLTLGRVKRYQPHPPFKIKGSGKERPRIRSTYGRGEGRSRGRGRDETTTKKEAAY